MFLTRTLGRLILIDRFCLLLLCLIGVSGCNRGPHMIYADYAHFSLSGDGENFNMLEVEAPSGLVPKQIFIRGADGRTYDLARLEEDIVREWVEQEPNEAVRGGMTDKGTWRDLEVVSYRFPARSLLFFHDGKLVAVGLASAYYGPFQGLEVGASSDGEFLKLPATKQEMIRVFGSPKKWTPSKILSP